MRIVRITTMLAAFGLASTSSGFAQAYQWATHGGDNTYQIEVGPSGEVYAAGNFEFSQNIGSFPLTNAGGSDIFLARYDANGTVQWAKQVGSSGSDHVYGLAVDPAGNVYIGGHSDEHRLHPCFHRQVRRDRNLSMGPRASGRELVDRLSEEPADR
jgi:hypothetical protein